MSFFTSILARGGQWIPTFAVAGGGEHENGQGGGGGDWILHHVEDGPRLDLFEFLGIAIPLPMHLGITKHTVFVFLAAILTFLIVWSAARAVDRVPRGMRNMLESIVKFLRDDVIYPNMGAETGRRFTPFLLTLFLFILIMNLLGLVPFGASATGNIYVTGALALVTFTCMLVGGMLVQGPIKFWISLVPHGVPVVIWPLLFVIELVGLIIKPFALMIRLFANMMAGHIVIFSLMSFIFTFSAIWYIIAPISVVAIVLFYLLELLVALIQAYVFTMLSAVFIGMSLHPEH